MRSHPPPIGVSRWLDGSFWATSRRWIDAEYRRTSSWSPPGWCMLNHSPWAAVCTGRSLWPGTGPWCSPFYGQVLVQEGGPFGGAGLAIMGRESLALLLKRGRGSSRLRFRSAGPSFASRRRARSYRFCAKIRCWGLSGAFVSRSRRGLTRRVHTLWETDFRGQCSYFHLIGPFFRYGQFHLKYPLFR